MTTTALVAPPRLRGIDHVEWWVGNARHTARYFADAFGFTIVAYAGPETGMPDRMSYVLEQGEIHFVVTSSLLADSEIAGHVHRHGDGVRAVAFRVDDAADAYRALVARGARAAHEPFTAGDPHGTMAGAAVRAYGDTVHPLVERDEYTGAFAPGYEPVEPPPAGASGPAVGLRAIDHAVANVERGHLADWVRFYQQVFGFSELVHFDRDQIRTEYSALASTVVWDGDRVVLPINEPADGLRRSQIEEFLDYYGGAGIQHLALRTDDIIGTVRALRERGVRFLPVPATYYEQARERLAGISLPWEQLAELGILVDRERDGHLLQIFTDTIASRPTVFLELIQRVGARGFGEGNFKALFESIEREQNRRGNL